MKKIHCTIAVASLLLTATNCSKNNTPEVEEKSQKQSHVQNPIELAAPLANAFTDFSFHFFKSLQTEQEADKNIFVSPLSLHMALGMLVNGADGETKAEILKALKSDHLSGSELNAAYKKLLTELPVADPLVEMALANAVFYKNSFPFEAAYLNSTRQNFNAQITGLPFVQADLATINGWASNNTQGKITKVLNEIDPDLVMLLMNALYFKGDWRSKFNKAYTKDQAFTLEGGVQKMVKMMNHKDTFRMVKAADFTALQMPYGNGQFAATLLLPNAGQKISDILNHLNSDQWASLQAGLRIQSVEVGLPKFKLEQEFELKQALKNMGMAKAFMVNAQFETMSRIKPLYVSFVKQNTFAAVDEEGTEAAAVTTIGMETTSAPMVPTFICNRPFGFIISEKTSNTILFMGRIMNPKE